MLLSKPAAFYIYTHEHRHQKMDIFLKSLISIQLVCSSGLFVVKISWKSQTDCLIQPKMKPLHKLFDLNKPLLGSKPLLVCYQWTCKCPEWMTDLLSSVYNLSSVPLFIHVFLWRTWRAVEDRNLSLHTVNIPWKRVQQLPNTLELEISKRQTDEVHFHSASALLLYVSFTRYQSNEKQLLKKKQPPQPKKKKERKMTNKEQNTTGFFGSVSSFHSHHRTSAFTTLIPNTTTEQYDQILLIKRPKPPLLETRQTHRHHLICLESKGHAWSRRVTLWAWELQLWEGKWEERDPPALITEAFLFSELVRDKAVMHKATLPETTMDRWILKGPVGRTLEPLCVFTTGKPVRGGSGLKPEDAAEEWAEQSLILDSYL